MNSRRLMPDLILPDSPFQGQPTVEVSLPQSRRQVLWGELFLIERWPTNTSHGL